MWHIVGAWQGGSSYSIAARIFGIITYKNMNNNIINII